MRLIAAALLCCAMNAISRGSELTVEDAKGAKVSIDLSRGPTVVAFISTVCPVSNAFNDRMIALYNDYSAKGVQFVFINSNANESAAEVAAHSQSAGFPFVVYRDPSNRAADALGAMATPETYVIDKAGAVRYHGFVEDSTNQARVKKRALQDALNAVLAGAPVVSAETKAFGCTIKRARRSL
jgi:thiol-disulfide isomerase/thioredoxin